MRSVRRDDEATKADLLLSAFMGGDPSGAIERQESRGQRAFLESETLPIAGTKPERGFLYDKANPNGSRFETNEEWFAHPDNDAFVALGFELGPQADDLFRYARIPVGWRKAGTNHAMNSDILDDRGRKRVGVFYKAAFYDRKASCHIVRLEGPNGWVYADHAFVPDPDTHPGRGEPMCGFTYGPNQNRCYRYEPFRWHHTEETVPYGDNVGDSPGRLSE